MNRVANMNPERRLKKLMSDRYENMSEERRIKKKEVHMKFISFKNSLVDLSNYVLTILLSHELHNNKTLLNRATAYSIGLRI